MQKISPMQKTLDLEQTEGKYSAFARVPFAIPVRLSRPLAENGYGTVRVNGTAVSRGVPFHMDSVVQMNCILVPVGEVANEFDREYTVRFSDFTADNGEKFKETVFKIRTLPRRRRSGEYAQHDMTALQAARESMVLLKNEGDLLPLKRDTVLNCFGAAQNIYRISATGAGLINPRWQANFRQAAMEHSGFRINETVSRLYERLQDVTPTQDQLERAWRKSDTAVLFLSRTSGEFLDNKPVPGGYYLTEDEESMIAAVCDVFEKTVAIINTGYPIDLRWLEKYNVKAAAYTGFGGMCSAYALMELLDGRENPSGKLPDTWALDYRDYPSSQNFINFGPDDTVPGEKEKGVRLFYEEDIYVGYRYFDTFQKSAQYCFGHGLSYTTFGWTVEWVCAGEEGVKLQAAVKNTGSRGGKEVLQLYIGAPDGRLEKPRRVLTDFDKTEKLAPGGEQRLTLSASPMDYASFDETLASWVLEPGEYTVYLGDSLENAEKVHSFTLEREIILKTVSHVGCPVERFHRMSRADPTVHTDSEVVDLSRAIPVPAERKAFVPAPLTAHAGRRVRFEELRNAPSLLNAFVTQMTTEELCALNVSTGADWYMPWGDGTAGGTRR